MKAVLGAACVPSRNHDSTGRNSSMNKSVVLGVVIGALVVTAGGAIAGLDLFSPKFAEVINVAPVNKQIRTPREECTEQAVTRTAPVKDQKRIAGTVIGAVVGGVLGSQVGSGDGRKIATAAGAAAGGYAGNKVQQKAQQRNTTTVMETRCKTVYDTSQKIIGYDVKYRLGKQTDQVRMDYDPGERIPVKDGQLVLSPPPATER
jgi:uncharacterized protein YcfJ